MARALRVFLYLLGAVAVVAGLLTVLTGAATVLDANAANPSLDSELRFYAAWYVVAGVLILRAARAPHERRGVIVGVAAAFGLAATARVLSWVQVGKPSDLAVALLVIEYLIAAALPPWHRRAITRRP